MRKARFVLDCLPNHTWVGYTDGGLWNGFACPFFTVEEGWRLHAALVQMAEQEGYDHDQVDIEWRPEDFRLWHEDDLALYGIGAWEWTWEEVQDETA